MLGRFTVSSTAVPQQSSPPGSTRLVLSSLPEATATSVQHFKVYQLKFTMKVFCMQSRQRERLRQKQGPILRHNLLPVMFSLSDMRRHKLESR